MAKYYANKNAQSDGYHEVHVYGCSYMPEEKNKDYLGDFTTCGPAVSEAKKRYTKADGCGHCSKPCHTR